MADFVSLDPDTRAVALVGTFLQHWALMERRLVDAIRIGLKLSEVQAAMVGANMALRDKINLVKTLTDLAIFTGSADKAQYIKVLNAISEASSKRNMMAHDLFTADDAGVGVKFFIVRAKGKLDFPDEIWDGARFMAEFAIINDFISKLRELADQIAHSNLVVLLATSHLPIDRPAGLAAASPPSHQLQGILGSIPQDASSPEANKTLPDAQEKDRG